MDLSLIIPVYNTEPKILEDCINSIINIDKGIEYEIIIVNDGSDEEKSLKYKSSFENKNNVVYMSQKNAGVSAARNFGIDIAKGKYIMFVDSDDNIYSKSVDKKYFNIDADILIFDKKTINGNKKYVNNEFDNEEGNIEKNNVLEKFISENKFHNPFAQLIKRKFIMDNNVRFNEHFIQGEDALFNLDMLLNNPKIYYAKEMIYEYHLDYSTYNNRWLKFPKEILNNFKYLYYKKIEALKEIRTNNKEEILEKLNTQYINATFSYSLILCQSDYKKYYKVLNDMCVFMKEINIKDANIYLKIKKNLIENRKWRTMHLISNFRSGYRKCKKNKC